MPARKRHRQKNVVQTPSIFIGETDTDIYMTMDPAASAAKLKALGKGIAPLATGPVVGTDNFRSHTWRAGFVVAYAEKGVSVFGFDKAWLSVAPGESAEGSPDVTKLAEYIGSITGNNQIVWLSPGVDPAPGCQPISPHYAALGVRPFEYHGGTDMPSWVRELPEEVPILAGDVI